MPPKEASMSAHSFPVPQGVVQDIIYSTVSFSFPVNLGELKETYSEPEPLQV